MTNQKVLSISHKENFVNQIPLKVEAGENRPLTKGVKRSAETEDRGADRAIIRCCNYIKLSEFKNYNAFINMPLRCN